MRQADVIYHPPNRRIRSKSTTAFSRSRRRPWPRVPSAVHQHRKTLVDPHSPPPVTNPADRITNPPKLPGSWRPPCAMEDFVGFGSGWRTAVPACPVLRPHGVGGGDAPEPLYLERVYGAIHLAPRSRVNTTTSKIPLSSWPLR
jgi:hypothetical protein